MEKFFNDHLPRFFCELGGHVVRAAEVSVQRATAVVGYMTGSM